MNIVLNSRILVGPMHQAADDYAKKWEPELPKHIEWMQSPSELCVLDIRDEPEPKAPVRERRATRPLKPAVKPWALATRLEDALRHHLGLKLPGEDPPRGRVTHW